MESIKQDENRQYYMTDKALEQLQQENQELRMALITRDGNLTSKILKEENDNLRKQLRTTQKRRKPEMKTDDKLIAEFMGFNKNVFEPEFYVLPSPYNSDGPFCSCEFLRFANSWDWLIPVVRKIIQMTSATNIGAFDIKNRYDACFKVGVIRQNLSFADINSVHHSVVEFIKWYNSQK